MSTKLTNKIASIMIFFAILLIMTGLYMNFSTSDVLDPIRDVDKANDNPGEVTITTNDGKPPATNSNDTNTNTNNGSSDTPITNDNTGNNTSSGTDLNPSTSNGNTNTGSNTNSSNNNTGNNSGSNTTPSTPIPDPTPTPEPIPDSTPVVDPLTNYRKQIEDTYGIKVLYGSETNGYVVGSLGTTAITDTNVMKSILEQLNTALSMYPNGFFREFSKQNMSLNVYLIKNYSAENVTGVTDFAPRRTIISIATDFPFDESFHHEMLHYIEHYIESAGGRFTAWNSFNPLDFTYGVENSSYSYSKTGTPGSYFVNNYAQTSANEDRASTFEYMTASVKYSCYDSNDYPIWKKSNYLSTMIETYFTTVSSSVVDYWERYIY